MPPRAFSRAHPGSSKLPMQRSATASIQKKRAAVRHPVRTRANGPGIRAATDSRGAGASRRFRMEKGDLGGEGDQIEHTVVRSALGARRSALGARRSALGARRSALGARRSALGARRSALGARRSALGARRSALGARRSALGARRSALGARRSALIILGTPSEKSSAKKRPRAVPAREAPQSGWVLVTSLVSSPLTKHSAPVLSASMVGSGSAVKPLARSAVSRPSRTRARGLAGAAGAGRFAF